MTPESKRVGRDIRDRMREEGRSQEDVARQLGVSQPRVSRVLAGDFTGRSSLGAELCKIFKVTPLDAPEEEADRAFQRVTSRLRSIWDGTVDGAANLGQLIETVRIVHLHAKREAPPVKR